MWNYLRILAAFSYLVVIVLLSACGASMDYGLPSASAAAVRVTRDFPAVVGVANSNGYCTGTFISDRAVLTAAHCTLANDRYGVFTQFGSYFTYDNYNLGSGNVNDQYDVSILVFNQSIAKPENNQVIDIGDQVQSGDTLTLLGNGCTDWTKPSIDGLTRMGTNVVWNISSYLQFLTPLNTNTGGLARSLTGSLNRAGACPGDSGGPALRRNADGKFRLVGVAHSGAVGNNLQSNYINVTDPVVRDFIRKMNTEHALGINGF